MNSYHDQAELPLMMTIEDLASFLRVSKNKAYFMVKKKMIPSVKVGRQIRLYREDVVSYLQRKKMEGIESTCQ